VKTFIVVAAALSAAGLVGCSLLQQLDGGTTSSGGGSTATTAAAGSTVAVGASCGVDPDTGATLCLGNSLCPDITINSQVFPACGFRIDGAVIDIECSCGYSLCPLGATTCATAQTLLASDNEGIVCAQLSAGTCAAGTPTTTTSASSSSSGGTCDTTCRDECGGDPTCIEACGC